MNVMYATDRNYAPICGVSLYSLLKNNQQNHFHIYIFEKDLHEEKEKFYYLCKKFNAEITFIEVTQIELMCKEMNIPPFKGGYMAYARLFADEYVGKQKVLYLDCDTLVIGKIDELWSMDMGSKPAAAVLDCIHCYANRFINKNDKANYINSGVILINYSIWTERKCTSRILESLAKIDISKTATYGDQDILNHAMGEDFFVISPKYNAMYITRYFSPKQNFIVLSKDENSYYQVSEIEDANRDSRIIHFAGRDILRPWFKECALSKEEILLWNSYKMCSPWNNFKKQNTASNYIIEKFVEYYLNHSCTFLCYIHRVIKKYSLLHRLQRGKRK